jgi:probable F420-dependent oxidoreductase
VTAPQLSVLLPNFGAFLGDGQWHRYVDLARAAEDAGVDRVVVVDHVVMGPHTDAYPWGPFPGRPDEPWLEPLTVLAAVAGATSRIRLATGVLVAPLRPAALLAKTAATLDVLSAGRLELGVGTGWQREEYLACGTDWERRGPLLDETLAACHALWRGGPTSLGAGVGTVDGLWCQPRPARGHVPVWVGGTLHRRNVERITRWGTGWIPIMGESPAGVAAGVARLRAALAEAGRDAAELRVQASPPVVRDGAGRPDLARTLATAPELVAAGGTAVHIALSAFCRDAAEAPRVLAEAAARFVAEVGAAGSRADRAGA